MTRWQPIQNLPVNWKALLSKSESLHHLADVWREEKSKLASKGVLEDFLARLKRKVAIETGIIERLYSIDRGVTQLLIEKGIDHSLIPHGSTDRSPSEIVTVIRDHVQATEAIFNIVKNERSMSTSFIKQLHQLLTRNQHTVEAMDQFGQLGEVALIHGDWKRLPNNPQRADGSIHEYCPPEQVTSQMDLLIEWHLAHQQEGVSPEVEAAWLHHRFTQIHPFQDGNGRVARLLATLVFLKGGWFPFALNVYSIHDQARTRYLDALEKADDGDLSMVVSLMADGQRQAFVEVLGLASVSVDERINRNDMLKIAGEKLRNSKNQTVELAERIEQSYHLADTLFELALSEFNVMHDAIQKELTGIVGQVQLSYASNNEERAGYYRYQIIETAKRQEYYANLNGYRAWILLSIRIDNLHQTEWLFSAHELGREQRGVMVCSMCAYRRYPNDQADTRELEPLSDKPFDFTYHESVDKLQVRFKEWLDELLNLAIAYWNKGL